MKRIMPAKRSSQYAIEAKNITKSFGKLDVLKGINLQVKQGSIFALLGPNGAGKTTIVRILTTLLKPDSGEALVNGYNAVEEPQKVRSVIGLTGQSAGVDEYLSGRENLQMMGRLYRLSRSESKARTEILLEQFGLKDAASRNAKTYSGGMRRRLDLALSLVAAPPIIFLDEPTTGLDPRSRMSMWKIVKQLAEDGSTILLTTQYLEEADQLADKIAVIDHGKVIASGTASQLKDKVGKERIEVSFTTDKDFAKAIGVIQDKSLQADAATRTLSVAHEGGSKQLRQLLEKLDTQKADIAGLSLHQPTLDDVFIQLTGRQASADEENGEKGE
jgi:ABC-2 type transport system ATP-binding protein